MSGDMIFSTGDGVSDWELVKHEGEWLVCKFSNERMRIGADGSLGIGTGLRVPEASQETHRFKTREFAEIMLRFCRNTQAIAESVGRTYVLINPAGNFAFFKPKELSQWTCHMFGSTPGNGFSWKPPLGQEPNAMWRWAQYLAFGNRWVKDGA